jgi:hypothetical protein
MLRGILAIAFVASVSLAGSAHAQNLNPQYTPHEQTADERLQNFRTPPPAPTTYPNISGQGSDARLNVTPKTSLGGSIGREGGGTISGNVRTTVGK